MATTHRKPSGSPKKLSVPEGAPESGGSPSKYPRHSLDRALRIPRAILEQNGGRDCTVQEAAKFAGLGYNGPTQLEMSSAIKYGLLERPAAGTVALTDTARQILRPQNSGDATEGLQHAALSARAFLTFIGITVGRTFRTRSF